MRIIRTRKFTTCIGIASLLLLSVLENILI